MTFQAKGFVVALVAALVAATPAHALKVATWNLLSYEPGNGGVTPRQADFRTLTAGLDPTS